MFPIVAPCTGGVVIGETVASVAPSGTRTLEGTSTRGTSLASLTSAPPGGAGLLSVTRACVGLPPSTLPGPVMIENSATPGGVGGDATTVKLADVDHGPRTDPW